MTTLSYIFLVTAVCLLLYVLYLRHSISELTHSNNLQAKTIRDLRDKIKQQDTILDTNKQLLSALADKHQSDMADKDRTIADLRSKQGISYCR